MKLNILKIRSIGIALAILTLSSTTFQSCTKEAENEINENAGKLTITARGINTEPIFKSANSNINKEKLSLHKYNDVDVAVSVTTISPTDQVKFRSSSNYEPLDEDIKYTVYFYEGEDLIVSKELTAGSGETIDGLNPSTEYTWVALSYNSTTTAPPLTPATTLNLPENTDVLYKKGTINLSNNSSLEVMFDRAMARVGIEINTIGIFGTINNTPQVAVTTSGLKSGALNILTGEVIPNTEASSPTLTFEDFSPIDGSADAVEAYLYTAPSSQQNIIVNVKNLQIKHYDNVGGEVYRTYFNTENGTTFTLNITPEKGKSQKAILNLVESPIITEFDGQRVEWARSNLYYRGDEDIRSYAFYSRNQLSSRADGYFSFGGTKPLEFANGPEEDPCELVYPNGLWRTPTYDDFNGLVTEDPLKLTELTDQLGPLGTIVNASGLGGLLNLVTGLLSNAIFGAVNVEAPNSTLGPSPYNYGQYTISGGAPSSTGSNAFGNASSSLNTLRFYYNGQINNLTVLQSLGQTGLVNLGLNNLTLDLAGINLLDTNIPLLDSYGRATTLWTSDRGAEVLGLASAGSWGYFGAAGRSFSLLSLGSRFHLASRSGEILNGVNALGVDVLSTTFKNVRCVRARDLNQ